MQMDVRQNLQLYKDMIQCAGPLYHAYGADGKLAEVGNELWSITDETGAAVDTLSDGTLYELRVSVADGGAFDLSETEKEIKISVVLVK